MTTARQRNRILDAIGHDPKNLPEQAALTQALTHIIAPYTDPATNPPPSFKGTDCPYPTDQDDVPAYRDYICNTIVKEIAAALASEIADCAQIEDPQKRDTTWDRAVRRAAILTMGAIICDNVAGNDLDTIGEALNAANQSQMNSLTLEQLKETNVHAFAVQADEMPFTKLGVTYYAHQTCQAYEETQKEHRQDEQVIEALYIMPHRSAMQLAGTHVGYRVLREIERIHHKGEAEHQTLENLRKDVRTAIIIQQMACTAPPTQFLMPLEYLPPKDDWLEKTAASPVPENTNLSVEEWADQITEAASKAAEANDTQKDQELMALHILCRNMAYTILLPALNASPHQLTGVEIFDWNQDLQEVINNGARNAPLERLTETQGPGDSSPQGWAHWANALTWWLQERAEAHSMTVQLLKEQTAIDPSSADQILLNCYTTTLLIAAATYLGAKAATAH